jgi:hypothetical protein
MRFRSRPSIALVSLAMLLACLGCAVQVRAVNSYCTTQESLFRGKRAVQNTFGPQDVIRYYVDLQWDDVTRQAGRHKVEWNWYSGDRLVSTNSKSLRMDVAPYEVWTTRPASALGLGVFKVETKVDGVVVAANAFTIRP